MVTMKFLLIALVCAPIYFGIIYGLVVLYFRLKDKWFGDPWKDYDW